MKKKFKLFTTILSFCFSLAVLCFGVYAASTVDYNLSGTISYEINDAYVEVTTNFYTTSTKFDLASAFKSNAETLETKTLAQLNSATVAVGDSTLTRLADKVNEYNSLTATEAHGDIEHDMTFTTENTAVLAHYIVVTVKNNGAEPAYIKAVDNNPVYIVDTNVITYRTNDVTEIAQGESENLVIGYALYDQTKVVEDIEYDIDIQVGLTKDYTPLKADAAAEYYYVEMGDFYGNPIRWRMVGTNEIADASTGNTELEYYDNAENFDANTLPTGVTGVFIQETNTGNYHQYYYNPETEEEIDNDGTKYTEREDENLGLSSVNFNRYKQVGTSYPYNYYAVDDDGNIIGDTNKNGTQDSGETFILPNNYFYSIARDYINGTEVYKCNIYDRTNKIYTPYTDEDASSMLTDFDISENDYVYSRIQQRNLSDMTTKPGTLNDDLWTPTQTDYASGMTGSDKMWLLSVEEALVLLGGVPATTAWDYTNVELINKLVWGYNNNEYDDEGSSISEDLAGSFFWLRSPYSLTTTSTFSVDLGSDWPVNTVDKVYAARAAFQLAI